MWRFCLDYQQTPPYALRTWGFAFVQIDMTQLLLHMYAEVLDVAHLDPLGSGVGFVEANQQRHSGTLWFGKAKPKPHPVSLHSFGTDD